MGNPQSLETGTVTDYQVVIFILIPGVWLQNNICSSARWSGGDQIRTRPKLIQPTEEKSLKPPEGVGTIAMIPLLSTFSSNDSTGAVKRNPSPEISHLTLTRHLGRLLVCCRGECVREEDQGCCGSRGEKVGRLFKEPPQTFFKVSKPSVICASYILAHGLARLASDCCLFHLTFPLF